MSLSAHRARRAGRLAAKQYITATDTTNTDDLAVVMDRLRQIEDRLEELEKKSKEVE